MATINGTAGNDTLTGTSGDDTIDGGAGADSLVGGAGDDLYFVDNPGDIVVELQNEGVDEVRSTINYVLPAWVNNLTLTGTTVYGTGNDIGNIITGNSADNVLNGATGNDTLTGGGGADSFTFADAPGAANADRITDFAPAQDTIVLDRTAMPALGAGGRLGVGDARFFAADGASSGHDADDRVVYDTSTGNLYYDADGNGAGAAQLIATLQGVPAIGASDIFVATSGQLFTGTAGNDSLVGGTGDDTLNGLDGNDTLNGAGGNDSLSGGNGNDSLIGGDGNDTLDSGAGFDTLSGGLGNDAYYVSGYGFDSIAPDPGGVDTVFTNDAWSMSDGDGIENLTMLAANPINHFLIGNNLDNVITGGASGEDLQGRGGNDTLIGNGGNDSFSYFLNPGETYGQDSVDGGAGFDTFYFRYAQSAVTVNFAAGTLTGGGAAGAGTITFTSIEGIVGSGFADRLDAGGTTSAVMLDAGGGNDTLIGGSGGDTLRGGDGDDLITGGAGEDSINAGIGSNHIDAGAGNDTITVQSFSDGNGGVNTGTDTIDGGDGIDTLVNQGFQYVDLGAGIAHNPPPQFSWQATNSATLLNIENVSGGYGNDTIIGSAAANVLDGFVGNDSIDGGAGNDTVLGGDGNDTLAGGDGNDSVLGGAGDDWFKADAGVDTLTGGAGLDTYHFDPAASGANADMITDFATGSDELVFDTTLFSTVGAIGNMFADDERFYAAAGATSGHDATDRVIYNTTTGQLFYDADGSDSGAAQLLATLQGAPALAPTDILVTTNGVAGAHLTGTVGPDRLEGGTGNDTLEGLDGNDTLIGNENNDSLDGGNGADSMVGGDGNDTLVGGYRDYDLPVVDTMDGGLGNDTYVIQRGISSYNADQVVLHDAGGIDTIVALSGNWVLAPGFENLQLEYSWPDDIAFTSGTGNAADNVITGAKGWWIHNTLDGGDGDDTLLGGDSDDRFVFAAGSGNIGHDSIDGGAGADWLDYGSARSAVTVDLGAGTASGGGNNGSGGATFTSVEFVSGSALDDMLIAGPGGYTNAKGYDVTSALYGGGGNDTLVGGASADILYGDLSSGAFGITSEGFGDDDLRGGAGNDSLFGGRGADWLDGGAGNDALSGGAGQDSFAFTAAAGDANADTISDFQTGTDVIRLDTSLYTALGATGRLSAGDERFYAAAGATSGHDATDRLIFDTSTGRLYYDADGSGGGAAQLIATVSGSSVAATDLIVGTDRSAPGLTLSGTAGDDMLTGSAGNDTLSGGAGNDTLDGGAGNDTMDGGLGNDTYYVSSLSDVLIDAGGTDTVIADANTPDYALRPGFENLVLHGLNGQGIGNDGANLIDASAATHVTLEGGGGNDTLIGSDAEHTEQTLVFDDSLFGGEGDDVIYAGRGLDYVEGGLGADSIVGGDGNDWLFGGINFYPLPGDGNDTIDGGAGNDFIQGGEGDDVLIGGSGDDQLWGDFGNDSLYGGDGNDWLSLTEFGWRTEHDLIDGGAGTDTLYLGDQSAFFATPFPVRIDLQAGTVTSLGSWSTSSATLVSIENAEGGRGSDVLVGSNGNNFLMGGEGYDTLDGGAGNDTLDGEGGDGYDGHNVFVFSAAPGAADADLIGDFWSGSDTIRLDARVMSALGASGRFSVDDDRFYAAAGATGGHDADDRIVFNTTTGDLYYDADGSGAGAGQLIATVHFLSFGSPSLSASDIDVVNGGPANGLEITGTAASEVLTGGSGKDAIDGGAGDDTISGAGGDDAIDGGAGRDLVTGGAGADVFVLDQPAGAVDADRITDFTHGVDRLQLDGNVLTNLGAPGTWYSGDARFYAAAGAAGGHDADDRIVYDTSSGNVWYDADGNGAGAAQLLVTLQPGAGLTETDIAVQGTPAGRETPAEIVTPPLSGDLHIDALLGNFVAWDAETPNDNVIQYTFSVTEGLAPDPVLPTAFNADLQAAARQALADVTAITGIQFQEVADGKAAEIHFANALLDPYGALGITTFYDQWQSDADGKVTLYQPDAYVYLDNFTSAAPGSLNYEVLLHELGHAMGLKHPFDYPVELMPGDDNNASTLMSYTQTVAPLDHYAPYDVAALQWLYGSDGLGGAGARAGGTPPTFGTASPDLLVGGSGPDYLYGDSGNDTLIGGAGNDWLIGGDGADIMNGGAGDDRYVVDNVDDVIVDSGGIDSVFAKTSWTLGPGLENLRLQFVYDDGRNLSATGNELDNIVSGNAGNNVISGLQGNDSLYGAAGNDTLDGGDGFDVAQFTGTRSGYTITKSGTSYTVSGRDGVDSVTGVERLHFDDVLVRPSAPLADTSGDGKSEIIARASGEVGVLQMDGTQVTAQASWGAGSAWSVDEVRGDYNGDGKSDILLTTPGDVYVWQMNGTEISSSGGFGASSAWHLVGGAGDYNGDGKSDIVLRHDNGTMGIWFMNGTSIGSAGFFDSSTTWSVAGSSGDYNGDGKSDFLVTRTGEVGIWQMDGANVVASASFGASSAWSVIGTKGDYNGDGKSDIVLRNGSTGDISIWLMDGTRIIGSGSLDARPDWSVIATDGDYNGDGKSDLLLREGGSVDVWDMNGTQLAAHAEWGASSAWTVHSATADYNGDGKSDILLENTSGDIVQWLMDGTNIAASGSAHLPPDWDVLS